MDSLSSLNCLHVIPSSSFNYFSKHCKTHLIVNSSVNLSISNLNPALINTRNQHLKVRVKSVSDVSEAITNPIQAQVTWEIVVGALAGVIPFIVAGIEFSKRIAAQRRCELCGGSGLVLRDKKYYFRCPGCGGFLPWQSWRRFFSG